MSQVDERQSTSESEHDVCGFQVAVDHALFLHVAQRKQQRSDARARGARGRAGSPAVTPTFAAAPAARARKLGFKEQRELQELPARIAALETEQAALTATIADPAYYTSRDVKAQRVDQDRLQAIDHQLLELLEKWESLEQRSGSAG